MKTAFMPKIDPVISELRFNFASQLIATFGKDLDVDEVVDMAAFLADFVAGELEDDDELEIEVTLDDDDDGDGSVVDLFGYTPRD